MSSERSGSIQSRRTQLRLTLAFVLCVAAAPAAAQFVPAAVAPAGDSGNAATPAESTGRAALAERTPEGLLRAARAHFDDGELDEGLALLEIVAADYPIVGDYAQALRAEALTEAGQSSLAVAAILDALADHPESPLRAELYRNLGDARLGFADEGGARAAWESALAASSSGGDEAELLLLLARSHERSRETKAATARYLQLWRLHPGTAQARAADGRLTELESAGKAPPRGAVDWHDRAEVLFRQHHNAAALESYDRALALGLSKGKARRARYQRAHTLFRMRRYPEAVEAFAALPKSANHRLWHARSLARSGQVEESIVRFERLASEGHGETGLRATYYAALLLDGRGYKERARRHFDRVAGSRSYPGLAHGALWRLAWREYLDDNCDAALPRLERLVEIEKGAIDELRWRYWRSRCLEKLGHPDAAAGFAELAAEFPFTYYGWRSGLRQSVRTLAPVRKIPSGKSGLRPTDTERPRILLGAGLEELARTELRRVRRRATSLPERLEVADLLRAAGDYNGAQRTVIDPYIVTLARGPVAGSEALWRHAWPAAYAEQVEGSAAEQPGGVGRELVYSIMREESGYRPSVLSISGAYGLMQIMPATGEKLARDTGRPTFRASDLLEPNVNVALGSHYLGQLSRRFPSRLSAAIASYNAGPGAVDDWMRRTQRDDDEWVEAIPYDQTRRYVKRVLRSLHAYRVLY